MVWASLTRLVQVPLRGKCLKRSAPLVDTILQNNAYSLNDRQVEEGIIQVEGKQKATKRRLNLKSRHEQKVEAALVIASLPPTQRECALVAQEKGVSSWITAIPAIARVFLYTKVPFETL